MLHRPLIGPGCVHAYVEPTETEFEITKQHVCDHGCVWQLSSLWPLGSTVIHNKLTMTDKREV